VRPSAGIFAVGMPSWNHNVRKTFQREVSRMKKQTNVRNKVVVDLPQ